MIFVDDCQGGYDHEGVVFKDHLLFRIGIELRPIPGGFSSSEALDAIGNRCNHLTHADESHHVEWGDQQSQGFRSCESNRDAA